MTRLSAIDLQERLRCKDASIICVTRRRAPSVSDVVRRLESASAHADKRVLLPTEFSALK